MPRDVLLVGTNAATIGGLRSSRRASHRFREASWCSAQRITGDRLAVFKFDPSDSAAAVVTEQCKSPKRRGRRKKCWTDGTFYCTLTEVGIGFRKVSADAMNAGKRAPYLLLLPTFVCTVVTLGLCLVVLIVLSLASQAYLDLSLGFDTANYQKAISSGLVHSLLGKSAMTAGLVTLASVLLAYPIAYYIAFDLTRHKLLWLIIFTLPCWISYLLRILSWKVILGYQGVINTSLISANLISEPISAFLYSNYAVVIALTHAWAPFSILPIYVSLEKIDRSLLRASADLGDRPHETFMRIVLPLSLPGVVASMILIYVPTFADYVTPQLLGGPYGVMIGNFIAMQFGASNNWPLGATVALLGMLVATLIVCGAILTLRRAVGGYDRR
jgi:spermidine/putrescine transport system permease protein